MKKILLSLLLSAFYYAAMQAQSVGIGTSTPKPSSLLDITSTSKGVLLPRLTTAQRLAIVNPERALLVFDTDKGNVMMFDGISWRILSLDEADKANLTNRNPVKPVIGERFGQAADISGNYAIIGAPNYLGTFADGSMGEAYIFYKDAGGWKLQARVAAPDSTNKDFFGVAVAIINDYCVVGCPSKSVDGTIRQGKVYVYKRNGTAWAFDAALTYPGDINSFFGYSVDITLNSANLPVVAVGAPGNSGTGRVITYKRVSNTWLFLQALAPADLSNGDAFGTSVSVQQDYLAIGAPQQAYPLYNISYSGAVYVFVYGGGVFTQQQKMQGLYKDAEFGFALALYGNMLAVGAPFAPADGLNDGCAGVFVFKRTGSVWDQIPATFNISNQNGGSFAMRYGITLSITNNRLLIGAPGGYIYPSNSSTGASQAGSAFLFSSPDGGVNYYLKQKFVSNYPFDGDLFGHSVAIEPGGNFIIGIPEQSAITAHGFFAESGGVYFGY
jgi:hypothetical protein